MRFQQPIFLLLAGAAVAGVALAGGEPTFRSAGSTQRTTLDAPCPAREFPPIALAFLGEIDDLPGTQTKVRCGVTVEEDGKPKQGVRVALEGEIIDLDGEVIAILGRQSKTTNRGGQKPFTWNFADAALLEPEGWAVLVEGALEGDRDVTSARTECNVYQVAQCANNATAACLNNKRFRVEVTSTFGQAFVTGRRNRQADFALGPSGSTDLIIKLLNQCSNNDHFWVFSSALTNVDFEVTVTDTVTGNSRAYDNPTPFQPILDTSAFATCP